MFLGGVGNQSQVKKNKFLSLSIHHSKHKDSTPVSNEAKNNDAGPLKLELTTIRNQNREGKIIEQHFKPIPHFDESDIHVREVLKEGVEVDSRAHQTLSRSQLASHGSVSVEAKFREIIPL